jgi:hypothetical protein
MSGMIMRIFEGMKPAGGKFVLMQDQLMRNSTKKLKTLFFPSASQLNICI